ncbi:alpha/beta hydrolase [Isoptericola sp. NPDC058082]|uniref:alpha/beta hydrolase n=1 Tax=Isoptericola sp. NPDC058082 TaxID=3346331 RepID=UPI0036EED383
MPAAEGPGPPARAGRPWLRRTGRAVTAVVVGALLALGLYQVSVQPGAAMLRALFDSGPGVTAPPDVEAARAAVAAPRTVPIPTPDAPDASAVVYMPRSEGPHPVVLWVHGGGFVSGSPATVEDFSFLLASRGYTVVSLDYTLAPEARYPVPVRQGNAALAVVQERIAELGGDPARIVLGGDSAGAQIASQLAAVQTNPRLADDLGLTPGVPADRLRAVVLYCGAYDLDTLAATGFPGLQTFLWAYTGHRDWADAPFADELSTTEQATADYPPTYLTVGDADPFESQSRELAAALEERGVPTETLFWDGDDLPHEYQFHFDRPQAARSFDATLDFLEDRTG